jgi:hypothetical protein
MMNSYTKTLAVFCAATFLSGVAPSAVYAGGEVDTTFHRGDFAADESSATITNPYWPQPEGTTFTYRSVGKDGCEINPVQVTDTITTIDGVAARQLHDQVYEDADCDGTADSGYPSEDTLDWYAQDTKGNIWYFGEDTASYCNPNDPQMVCTTMGSWKAGENGAKPGIVMLANPSPGAFYRQEYAEDAHDMAKVLRLNSSVTLGFDNSIDPDEYADCLITKEWSPLENGSIEHKYYCPGKGLMLIEELQSGPVRTELVGID